MGQAQSEELDSSPEEEVRDTSDQELNSSNQIESAGELAEGKHDLRCQQLNSVASAGKLASDSRKLSGKTAQQKQQQKYFARKMSNVSQGRNIQLLSMRPRNEREQYADDLKRRRRSSLINLILGAPSSGPRFCDDLCSINSRLSNFGIEFFPDASYPQGSCLIGAASRTSFAPSIVSSWRLDEQLGRNSGLGGSNIGLSGETNLRNLTIRAQAGLQFQRASNSRGPKSESLEQVLRGAVANPSASGLRQIVGQQQDRRRRSSIGSIAEHEFEHQQHLRDGLNLELGVGTKLAATASGLNLGTTGARPESVTNESNAPSTVALVSKHKALTYLQKPSLASTLASIDLTSSFEQHQQPTDDSSQAAPSATTNANLFQANLSSPMGPAIFQQANSSKQHHQLRSNGDMIINGANFSSRIARSRLNQSGRVLRRSGSELSLYSNSSSCISRDTLGFPRASITSSSKSEGASISSGPNTYKAHNPLKETQLIIILQVCLPFIFAGFGNMGAGLVLGQISQWEAFVQVPAFIVLLPPLVGLKGNIEMTLASRLSTLSNLNLLDTSYRRRRAYLSNLTLIVSQAMGLSVFAALVAMMCELLLGGSESKLVGESTSSLINGNKTGESLLAVHMLLVLASALATTIILAVISSIVMSLSICVANWIQVNPDNLSTLVAALYGDVSCVTIYGLISNAIFLAFKEQARLIWPLTIVIATLLLWPPLLFASYKLEETHSIALASLPPMLTSIMISMGSGSVLSLAVARFKLMAIYQPVLNGFSANLIAVQASRVSTWLWCTALDSITMGSPVWSDCKQTSFDHQQPLDQPKKTIGSLASFIEPAGAPGGHVQERQQKNRSKALSYMAKLLKNTLWSFFNESPNAIAARLLLIMLIPAHSIYFMVLWLVSPAGSIVLTWQFYLVYIAICIFQGFILLTICQPLMTLLMNRNFDPDIFGISILMALADLTGTLCLTGAFSLLALMGDANAI